MKKNYSSILTSTNVVTSAVNKAISKAQIGITTAASPLKTSNTAVKQIASVRPTTAPATYSTGRNVVDAQSIRKTLNDTRLLNEQKQREAQAVQQLPNDFPIENWEKMPVKAQLFAVQHSGLSKEDQWTVLNLMNPIKDLVNVAPPKPATAAQNRIAPINVATKTIPAKTTVTTSSASSGKESVPFSGQDAETQRAEQRASRQATDAYYKLNEKLESKNVNTSSLSGTGNDIYKSARITMANEVVQGTLDPGKQTKMIDDASAGIAPGKTAPTSVQDWKERVSQADTASKEMFDMLESVHVDTDHLTTQQSYIIEKAERMLRDGIISGALTIGGADEMVRRICNQVTSETTPPKGVTYITLGDPKLDLRSDETKRNQIMINRGSAITQANQLLGDALVSIHVDTSDLSEKQREIILEEQPKLVEGILNGSLNGDAISAFVDNVCYRIATETTPPPGVTYVEDGLLINNRSHTVVLADSDQKTFIIPEGVTTIGTWAFRERGVETVQFPSTLQTIGIASFLGCENLTALRFPSSLTAILAEAFYTCENIQKIDLPESIRSIGVDSFNGCGFRELEIPNGIELIDAGAFSDCRNLERVKLPSSLKNLGSSAFTNCTSLTNILLPEGLETIGEEAFLGCENLKEVSLPETLREIGEGVFKDLDFNIVEFPEALKLGDSAFGRIHVAVFTGWDYEFSDRSIDQVDVMLFLNNPPQGISKLNADSLFPKVYYTEPFANAWKAEVTNGLNGWPTKCISLEEVDVLIAQAVATPQPTEKHPATTDVFGFFNNTPEPSIQPETDAGTDPLVYVFAGLLVLVAAGIVVIGVKTRKKHRANPYHTAKPE